MTLATPELARAFALYAAIGGALVALGLLRDIRVGLIVAGREAVVGAIGIVALLAAFSAGANETVRLFAGAMLLAGLAILALAPRRPERRSPGRQVGLIAAWAGICVALAGVLFQALAPISSA